ncbi:MAG: bifunctional adenosylcobinamide kinase/adenosylcobinamide-phosphate guanylyltransferase [Campylobacterales bacterium]|nr:bifunctional adenosylcobinamide kinase/adenosylcobinamide-phosphate guanylyltransferase [Campylobacterales bacterium]
MKVLYIGGQKSGKSALAEQRALVLSKKPFYVATYNNTYSDSEMEERIENHQKERKNLFLTLEEPLKIHKKIKKNKTYLIDCLNMWVLNMMMEKYPLKKIIRRVEKLMVRDSNLVFVLTDLSKGVIPDNNFSREYIDVVGKVGQIVASNCDEVHLVHFGIGQKIK